MVQETLATSLRVCALQGSYSVHTLPPPTTMHGTMLHAGIYIRMYGIAKGVMGCVDTKLVSFEVEEEKMESIYSG